MIKKFRNFAHFSPLARRTLVTISNLISRKAKIRPDKTKDFKILSHFQVPVFVDEAKTGSS